MNFIPRNIMFCEPSVRYGYTERDFVKETIGVKTDMRFYALIVMFMIDTNYTLGDRFITNFNNGLMDAFTARKFLMWASERANASRHEKYVKYCEDLKYDGLRKTLNRENKSSTRNRNQLYSLGIVA